MVPATAIANAAQPSAVQRGVELTLQNIPAIATNHTSTERSTCTTRATRKKFSTGKSPASPGVREATSRIEYTPAPMIAASASCSHPRATLARASAGTTS